MNISIIGGDLRIVRLAQMYANERNRVYTYGLEKYFKESTDENIIVCEELQKAIDESKIIISAIPFSKDGINVNAPYADKTINIEELEGKLSNKVFIAGGIPKKDYKRQIKIIDLLKNEKLTILNAIPTVEGTIKIAIDKREETIYESNVLICGFGRIGKILCDKFRALGSNVYCVARKESDLTWIREKRCVPLEYCEIEKIAHKIDILINTVPTMVIDKEKLEFFNKKVLMIDVASNPGGIDKEYANKIGIQVITALGIPGKETPLTAAKYIKEAINGYDLRLDIKKRNGINNEKILKKLLKN